MIEDNDLELFMESSFTHKLCEATRQAVNLRFPSIKGLDVFMSDRYDCVVVAFNEFESGCTNKEVIDFLAEFKKQKTC